MESTQLPEETIIYYSQNKILHSWIIFGLGLLGYAAYWFFDRGSIFMAVMFGLCAIYIIYAGIKKIRNKSPQLTLSNKGISTFETSFKSWAEIKNEEVYIIPFKNYNAGVNFRFSYDGGEVNMCLESLAISEQQFRTLIKTYRQNSVKLYPEIYSAYKHKEKTNKEGNELQAVLSDSQQAYLAKKSPPSADYNNRDGVNSKASSKMELSQICHPFLIFFCLLVSPAVIDQFAPLKTKTEIIKDVTYGVEKFKIRYSISRSSVLNITTYTKKYKLFGQYAKEYDELYKGDTLTILKTQILNIPRKFETSYISFENHDEDYLVFYTAFLVIFLFFLSLVLKGDVATLIIFGLSMASTVVCVGVYI